MIFAGTLLVGAALLCGATAHAQAVDCSTAEYVPHPTDCNLFYACEDGLPILENCPSGLWWNPGTSQCDWPDVSFCSPGTTTSTVSTTTGTGPTSTDGTTGTGTGIPENPCVGNEPEFFPHPTDCTLFYKCWEGEAYLNECPPGLWWHQSLGECDWPDEAFCTPGSTTTSTGSTGTTSAPTGPAMPCPAAGSDPVRYPHLTDCNLYYLCVNGATQLYTCSEGQEFDPIARHCVDEATAGCSACPSVDVSGVVVRLPHESQCHLYYRCNETVQTLFQCQLDHHFSRFDRNCHPQAEAFCQL